MPLSGTKPATDKAQIAWNAGCGKKNKNKADFVDELTQPSNQQHGVNNNEFFFFVTGQQKFFLDDLRSAAIHSWQCS